MNADRWASERGTERAFSSFFHLRSMIKMGKKTGNCDKCCWYDSSETLLLASLSVVTVQRLKRRKQKEKDEAIRGSTMSEASRTAI